MSFLLDTNVFSELHKGARCDSKVSNWWSVVNPAEVYLSVLVLGEVRRGISRIERAEPSRARNYERWLEAGLRVFAGRILGVDARIADQWGRITSARSMPVVDSMLAATALCHDITLVTRNTRDIADCGARYLNPFES